MSILPNRHPQGRTTDPSDPSDPSNYGREIPPKPCDEILRATLQKYKQEQGLSLADLARELATNTTQVSKYLSGRPEGDVARLERIARDVLKSAELRKAIRVQLFENNVTRIVAAVCETIKKTGDIGLIHGPAGIGKTCAIQVYLNAHPSAILITATKWQRSATGLAQLIFAACETQSWPGNVNRAGWLTERFRGSNRLIIVDNAQRLTRAAAEFLFDFHDQTGCPIALVGNPDILETCRSSDQLFSRIGLKREIKQIKEPKATVQKIVEQLCPEANGDLNHLGEVVVEQKGHCRALKKQVLLAADIRENQNNKIDWETAFKSAHTQLIRDYQLKD